MELESSRSRLARWIAAIALVVLAEGAALAWILGPVPTEDWESQTGGAFILELSEVSASPDDEHANVAIGKRSQEIAPVTASAPQVSSAAVQEMSQDPPLPALPEAPPEESQAKPPIETPPERLEKPVATPVEAKDAPAVAPVAASEAAAPERIENATEKSEAPRGQNAGLSRIDRQSVENWQRDLVVHLNRHKKYPLKAREAQQHGVVTVAFSIDRDGRLVASRLAKGTGFEELDRAALDMLKRASPMPAPPAAVSGDAISFVVPVRFRWRD